MDRQVQTVLEPKTLFTEVQRIQHAIYNPQSLANRDDSFINLLVGIDKILSFLVLFIYTPEMEGYEAEALLMQILSELNLFRELYEKCGEAKELINLKNLSEKDLTILVSKIRIPIVKLVNQLPTNTILNSRCRRVKEVIDKLLIKKEI